MRKLPGIFDQNRQWAEKFANDNPGIFDRLAAQQAPDYLWIGCADSRVPANQICGLEPGEVFVHRNIANQVIHTDINCLSVLQYAVDALKVKHVIVCGHYGCGGVKAAMGDAQNGLIDNWLRHIKDVYAMHHKELDKIDAPETRARRLCELNVEVQVANVCHTTIVQDAWARGQELTVHGWIYGIADGRLKDLDLCVDARDQLPPVYRMA